MPVSHSSTPVELDFPMPTFDFSRCDPATWNGGSAPRSHFWNTVSSLLPNAEFCAIRCLIPLTKCVADPKLKRELRQFCAQESTHGTTHGQFNQGRLNPAYPGLARIENWERSVFLFFGRYLPARLYLAMFVAIEHWTAAVSHHGLTDPARWFSGCDRVMYRLWEWHAVEELAHKSVCHDVFRCMGGGYPGHVAGMLLAAPALVPGIVLRLGYLYWKDGLLLQPRAWWGMLTCLLGRDGVLTLTARDFVRYFSPRFQPWDVDSLPLIRAYRQKAA